MLRNFGHLIMNARIIFTFGHNKYGHNTYGKMIESYLAEYASDALVHIAFGSSAFYFFQNIQKPFTNVKTLHMNECFFERELPFNRNFPNLQSLKLGMNQIKYSSAIKLHFLALTDLALHDPLYMGYWFDKNDVEDLLKLNPQLEKLELRLHHGYCPQFISRLKQYCPNLKHLGLGSPDPISFREGFEPVHFDQIEKFTLKDIEEMSIPFSFSKLQSLEIRISDKNVRSTDILNFIGRNPHLTSLKLELSHIVGLSHFFRDERLLLNIEDLRIGILRKDIPSDDLLYFLTRNRSLKRFSLTGKCTRFRHFYNAIISRDIEFKIRNKAIEFTVTKTKDESSVKYVLRFITRGGKHGLPYDLEQDVRDEDYGDHCDDRIIECCSYNESPHLISHKYDEYINALYNRFNQYDKNDPHQAAEYQEKLWFFEREMYTLYY